MTIDRDSTESTVAQFPYGDLATFGDLTIDTPGTYQLTASSGGVSLTDTREFTVSPAAVSQLALSGLPTSVTAGTALPQVTVHATDSLGNPVSGAVVTLSVAGGGTVAGDTATTDADGDATFDGATIDQAGTYTLTASSGSVSVSSTKTLTVNPGAVFGLTFTTQPSGAVAGRTLPTFVVRATDVYGNPVPGANVTLSLAGGGQISGSNATTRSDGTAPFDDVSIAAAGTYTITATSGTVSRTSGQLVITPAVGRLVPTTLTMGGLARPFIVAGQSATITGTLTAGGAALPGQTVVLLYRKAGSTGAWTTFATKATSNATGAVSFSGFAPTTTVQVELSYVGSGSVAASYGAAASAARTLRVVPRPARKPPWLVG